MHAAGQESGVMLPADFEGQLVFIDATASSDIHGAATVSLAQSCASTAVVVAPAVQAKPDFDQPLPSSHPHASNASRRGWSQIAPVHPPTQSQLVVSGYPRRSAQSTASRLFVAFSG